ncbi:MAG TPA: VCBS repeat-containing protein, partial [Segetibacter sp.]
MASTPACKEIKRNNSHPDISNSDIAKGEKLALRYCQSCHSFPDPSLLDSKTWEKGVLPLMGPRLGIFNFNNRSYPNMRNDMGVEPGYYPSKPVITQEEWSNILKYYVATAPDSLPAGNNKSAVIRTGLPGFQVMTPSARYDNPSATLVKFLDTGTEKGLLINDALRHQLYRFDSKTELVDSVKTRGPIVDIDLSKNPWITCDIGIMSPNTGKHGSIGSMSRMANGRRSEDPKVLINKLERPVQLTTADFNGDGKSDYL